MIQLLLEHGAAKSVNQADCFGHTLLTHAAFKGNLDILNMLTVAHIVVCISDSARDQETGEWVGSK